MDGTATDSAVGHPSAPWTPLTATAHAVLLGGGYRGLDPAAGDPAAVATVTVVTGQPDAPEVWAAARAAAALADRTGVAPIRGTERPQS